MSLSQLKDQALLRSEPFVGGRFKKETAVYPVHNPATGESLVEVGRVQDTTLDEAIAAARQAFESFRHQPQKVRAQLLRKLYDLMLEHQHDLALLLTLEQGKPLKEALGEIHYAAGFIDWYSEQARRLEGRVLASHVPTVRNLTLRQPVGVCVGITPWNFPCAMITRKLGAAIACGCTMLLKPAEATPLSALALAVLCERAGFPEGVVSVLTGNREDAGRIGARVCADPRVAKISFTGSTRVGKMLLAQSASTVKRVSLELGGNAPFIVFDDAELDAAVSGAIASKFRNCGQTCVSANRFLVQAGIFDAFVERLSHRMAELRVGSGLESDVQLGPLINREAFDKVQRLVSDAVGQGATLHRTFEPAESGPAFYPPTLLTRVTPAMAIVQEESFGPVAPIVKFETEEQAIALANDTRAGLAAYFFTKDMARCWRVAEALEYGMVGTNTGMVSTELAPFGGVKESGLGREGSQLGVDDYLEHKFVCVGGIGAA